MLYSLIISPIETLVSWIFNFFTVKFSGFGIIGAVCGVSLAINFLALPLYNIADALQEKERKAAKALEPRVKRIKKAFKGNEQFMMLSTYYRQNNYHPLYVLRSSLSILIEIPFFIAAYHYLSNCQALKGSSFWIFKDLGSPDGLLHIGTFPIHILPIIMTLINFVSGAIYTKDAVFREKIQLYIVALLFLVLLYNSPSGLVIYWILNNLFSLVKNIVMKMKNPKKILHVCVSALLLFASFYFFKSGDGFNKKKFFFFICSLVIVFLPLEKKILAKCKFLNIESSPKSDFLILLFSGIGLALLCGFVIPSSVISTSVAEFSFLGNTASPVAYIKNNFFVFAGFFILWPLVIYKMFGPKVKKYESMAFFVCFILALANVYIFKANYGDLNFLFEVVNANLLSLNKKIYLTSILFFILICAIYFLIKKFKKEKILSTTLIAFCLALTVLGSIKTYAVKNEFNIISKNSSAEKRKSHTIQKEYNLSKSKKNVVVLFLDRAINSYTEKIFEDFPQIKKQFEGFTYFPNTLSFSTHTVTASPAMMGSYEYSQENMNARNKEKLRDKHNEALLVMPKIFSDADFEVTVTDLPWPNYYWSGDLSFFNEIPQAKVSEIEGKYYGVFKSEGIINNNEKGNDLNCKNACIDFATLQCLPPFLRYIFYFNVRNRFSSAAVDDFYSQLSNLYYLPEMTDFSSQKNTFTFIENEATHNANVILNDDFLTLSKEQNDNLSLKHYQANVAVFKQIGKWLDYLRKNKVYDNTRIIIVSDHGRDVEIPCGDLNVAWYSALLMEKDFNSNKSVQINNDFMTNADTLFLAKKDLPVSNTNPFTKKEFFPQKANGVNVYYCVDWNAGELREAKQFKLDKNQAFHVSGDIYKKENWIPLKDWEKSNGQNGGNK